MAYDISKLSQSQAASVTTQRSIGWSEDKDGNIYAAFSNEGIWKITPDGNFSKIIGAVYNMAHLPDAMGYIYYRDTSNNLMKFHPSNPKNGILVEASISDFNTIAVHPKRRETIYFSKYTSGQILAKVDKGGSSVVATGSGYTMHEMFTDGTYLWIPLYNTDVQVWTISTWGSTNIGSVSGNPSGVSPYKGNTVLVTRDDNGNVARLTNSAIVSSTLLTSPKRAYGIYYSERRGTIFIGGSQTGAGEQNYVANFQRQAVFKPTMLRSVAADPVTNVTVSATVVSATFSIPAPTVTAVQNVTVTPAVQSATFSMPASTVTVTQNVTITPAVQSATFSIPAPNILTPDAMVEATVVSATFSVPAPTVTAIQNVTVSPAAQVATFSIPSPSVRIDASIAPSALSATFSIPAPTVTSIANVTVSASVLEATFSIPSPSVGIGATITPASLGATFSIPSVTITAERSVTVTPSVLTATFSIPRPRKTGGLWQPQARANGDADWAAQPRVSG